LICELAGDILKGLPLLLAAASLLILLIVIALMVRKFSTALSERDAALDRLRGAYRDLESAKPLRELGRSAAFINHEIKNHMMVISGYAALLLRSKKLDEKDRAMADNITAAVAKLHDFSMSVMELSQPKAKNDGEEFEPAQRLRSCIGANFAERASGISVNCGDALLLNGNPEKLERAFTSALRNSFEAGAQNVSVRLSACNQTALMVIDDDGTGCSAAALSNLSTTFFTTKRTAAGIGLGLCEIRSAVEAYNGSISIYAKNILGGGKHGLMIQILLPASRKTLCETVKSEVMLLKDGLPDIQGIMSMLKNLKIIPHTAVKVKNIEIKSSSDLVVIAAVSKKDDLKELTGRGKIKVLHIEEAECGVLLVVDEDGDRELFTEEYIIKSLI